MAKRILVQWRSTRPTLRGLRSKAMLRPAAQEASGRNRLPQWLRWMIASSLMLALCLAPLYAAPKLTAESPEVQKAIARGVKFLESEAANDARVGAKALTGLVLLKNGAETSHPKIADAVAAIQSAVRSKDPKSIGLDIYSSGLAIIFLVTLDSSKYGPEIEALLTYLQAVQKPHGGWGYADKETGDTSMTQYAVLSSWEATQAGFRIPRDIIEKVANWLAKTQDPNGGFGYQGIVAEGSTPVKQQGVKHSMTAAGLGSVYICANLLGMSEKIEQRDDTLPKALKEVKKEQTPEKQKNNPLFRALREAQSGGNGWMRGNYKIDPEGWTLYYLYALERYWSFREAAEGEKEGPWYSDGARFLIHTQSDDGSWSTRENMAVPDTAFATLFLLRSSKKSIERAYYYGAGVMRGGRGMPRDTTRLEVRMGQVVARPTAATVEKFLPVMDDPDSPDYPTAVATLAALPPQEAGTLAAKHGEKLRNLAESGPTQARVAAIRVLAGTRKLEHVPLLIFALSDPDSTVTREAGLALQQLSRKTAASELGEHPSPADRQAAIEKWKTWYLSIRPDAEFQN